jgi:hypothetical protein
MVRKTIMMSRTATRIHSQNSIGYLVCRFGSGADNDHWDAFDQREKLFSAQAREHEIQEDQIRAVPGQIQEGFRPGVSPGSPVPFFYKHFLEHVSDTYVIVDDQDCFHSCVPPLFYQSIVDSRRRKFKYGNPILHEGCEWQSVKRKTPNDPRRIKCG